ncbi:MAG: hypothetical protein Q7S21_01450 [archaeon]|nr:hypothetical protein [archaeon]
MEKAKNILVDASVLISKFRGEEPPVQQQHTDLLVELIEKNPLKVLIIKKVFEEIGNKYSVLIPSVEEFFDKLKAMGKFESIDASLFDKNKEEILNIKKESQNEGFSLSFADVAQIFYSKTYKVPLITWDNGIIDYCELHGIKAFRPNNFYEEYMKKY